MGRKTLYFITILLFVLPFFTAAQSSSQQNRNLSLDEALQSLGNEATLRWDPFFSSGTLAAGGFEAAFTTGRTGETGTILLDHRDVLTLPLPFLEGGNIYFPEVFIQQIRNSFSSYAEEANTQFKVAVIVIDPGHGGRDPGTVWDYTVNGRTVTIMEKDITLRVARMLHAALRAAYPDKRVLLTREGDTNPSLDERVDIANSVPLADNEAAIYVSVHANSSFNRNAQGFEVFYLNPSHRRDLLDHSRYADAQDVIPILNTMLEERTTTESILLANSILRYMDEAVGHLSPNRGIKAHDWFVVRNALMPSVLVELGFVSNREEALRMNDDVYLRNLSDALYKGISDFISFFEGTGGSNPIR
ncbi:MAG: N-acetylmuramoyl-L-alanine amidase [Treponema sp.]|nr:N-acetylmuramoyl-L-alanine amidase [Treponema sp.]